MKAPQLSKMQHSRNRDGKSKRKIQSAGTHLHIQEETTERMGVRTCLKKEWLRISKNYITILLQKGSMNPMQDGKKKKKVSTQISHSETAEYQRQIVLKAGKEKDYLQRSHNRLMLISQHHSNNRNQNSVVKPE